MTLLRDFSIMTSYGGWRGEMLELEPFPAANLRSRADRNAAAEHQRPASAAVIT